MSRYFVQEVYGKRFSGVNPGKVLLSTLDQTILRSKIRQIIVHSDIIDLQS